MYSKYFYTNLIDPVPADNNKCSLSIKADVLKFYVINDRTTQNLSSLEAFVKQLMVHTV